jgi:hypothetical protein
VLARAHQSLIWARQRHVNSLRSALREFCPGALAALGAQLAEPEALAILELAPTPEQGRRLTRAAIRRALVGAGRQRNLQARVVAVHDGLVAPQLAAPEPVEAAYRQVVGALVATLRCLNQQIRGLEQQFAAQFATHRDAAIICSQPGLGVVLGPPGPRRHPPSGTAGVGESVGWDLAWLPGPPGHLPGADRLAGRRVRGLTTAAGVPGAATPRRYWPPGSPGGRRCRQGGMPRGQARWDGRARWLLDQAAAAGGSTQPARSAACLDRA